MYSSLGWELSSSGQGSNLLSLWEAKKCHLLFIMFSQLPFLHIYMYVLSMYYTFVENILRKTELADSK